MGEGYGQRGEGKGRQTAKGFEAASDLVLQTGEGALRHHRLEMRRAGRSAEGSGCPQRPAQDANPLRVNVGPREKIVHRRQHILGLAVAIGQHLPLALTVGPKVEEKRSIAVFGQQDRLGQHVNAVASQTVAEDDGRSIAGRNVPSDQAQAIGAGKGDRFKG